MAEFIEVHVGGDKRLINLSWVEKIHDDAGGATVYFAFNNPEAYMQDAMKVDESYAEILRKIWR